MIAGVATDTMVESTRIMKNPSTSAHSAGQGRTSGRTASCGLTMARLATQRTGRGSDVAFEDTGLGQAGQALADGAGPVLADALDRLQVVDACRQQLL